MYHVWYFMQSMNFNKPTFVIKHLSTHHEVIYGRNCILIKKKRMKWEIIDENSYCWFLSEMFGNEMIFDTCDFDKARRNLLNSKTTHAIAKMILHVNKYFEKNSVGAIIFNIKFVDVWISRAHVISQLKCYDLIQIHGLWPNYRFSIELYSAGALNVSTMWRVNHFTIEIKCPIS